MNGIHPTACIASTVRLAGEVEIGPYVVIEDHVSVGPRSVIGAHAVLKRGTSLGSENIVHEGAVIGGSPQHPLADSNVGVVHVGHGNTIRENVTIHAAIEPGSITRVGDRNTLMVQTHVGHNCRIGHHVILENNTQLSPHAAVGDFAHLCESVVIQKFCRVGSHALIVGQAHIKADVLPYVVVDGLSNCVIGLNVHGMRRRGFESVWIDRLQQAYRVIFEAGLSSESLLSELEAGDDIRPLAELLSFLKTTPRGYVRARQINSSKSPSVEESTPSQRSEEEAVSDQPLRIFKAA